MTNEEALPTAEYTPPPTVRVGTTERHVVWVGDDKHTHYFILRYADDGSEVFPGHTFNYERVCAAQAAMNDLAHVLGFAYNYTANR